MLYFSWGDASQALEAELLEVGECGRCQQKIGARERCVNCQRVPDSISVSEDFFEIFSGSISSRERNARRRESREIHMSQTPGWHTKDDLEKIYQIQNGQCYFCDEAISLQKGAQACQVDHLVAVSRTGSDWPENLRLVCLPCNSHKGASPEAAFLRSLAKRKGEKWRQEKVVNNATVRKAIRKVSENRKSVFARYLNELKASLRSELQRAGASVEVGDAEEVTIKFDAGGLTIEIGDRFEVAFPPHYHRRISELLKKRRNFIDSIVALWRSTVR